MILLVALRFGRSSSGSSPRDSDEVLLLKVLGLTVLVAGVAQQLQVSAAVGAFLVGIALSGPLAHTARELLTPLRDLFAAVFFVFFGLQTDPRALPPVLGIAVAARPRRASLTKIATGWWAARRAGVAITRPGPRRRRAACPAASSTSSSPGWRSPPGPTGARPARRRLRAVARRRRAAHRPRCRAPLQVVGRRRRVIRRRGRPARHLTIH